MIFHRRRILFFIGITFSFYFIILQIFYKYLSLFILLSYLLINLCLLSYFYCFSLFHLMWYSSLLIYIIKILFILSFKLSNTFLIIWSHCFIRLWSWTLFFRFRTWFILFLRWLLILFLSWWLILFLMQLMLFWIRFTLYLI